MSDDNVISLTEVSRLAHLLVHADGKVERIEEELKLAKEDARRLREESLPSAMQELGLTKLVIDTGETITVGLEVYVAIPVAGRAAAYKWLEEHDFGGLIKTELGIAFPRDEKEHADELAKTLRAQGFPVELDQSVHAGTMKAWIKEQLALGADIPLDLFGARPVDIAKVKPPAKPRAKKVAA